jgi:hypothetical protein
MSINENSMDIIPNELKSRIDGITDEVQGAVGCAISSVTPFLERNEAIFFQDYTDHGISHIKNVLKTCEFLISPGAWEVFTREDAAALVIGVIGHDLGMLIDIDGFRFLIENDQELQLPHSITRKPWKDLWIDFELEVKRFDGSSLMNLFGSPDPVKESDLNLNSLTNKGIKAIGELIRRNHHILAYEIIMFGFPSGNGRILLFNNVPDYLKEMAAVLSLSHGVSLRDAINLLIKKEKNCHRAYRNIHPSFLMVLIRISDYLDIDSGRAPSSILSAKSLKSPISKREWWAHKSIVECHSYGDDPECLQVVLSSENLPNAETFCVVKDKLSGIQTELDYSWAVLGEVYGRFAPLNKLSINIRRINSNLNEEATISKLSFIPHRIKLETARADLLKLLIEPLYGDRPEIGVRELLQNAFDSIRELEFLSSQKPLDVKEEEREELDSDVVLSIEKENGSYWVVIADRGIGMTWETVQKYYLTAGASFRQSDAWKKLFTDSSGSSQVLRAGRFGIGVLSAFMIGERVQVSTRHIGVPASKGVQFEFGIDDTNIELKWITKNAGTTVKIETTKQIAENMAFHNYHQKAPWDWYCLKKPSLTMIDSEKKNVVQKYNIPGLNNGPLPKEWHRISTDDFPAIDWSYKINDSHISSYNSFLVCNGLYIGSKLQDMSFRAAFRYSGTHYIAFHAPIISVSDPDGRFPLNLARDNLAGDITDLVEKLSTDICKNFISFCLLQSPFESILNGSKWEHFLTPKFPGNEKILYPRDVESVQFYSSRHGFGLLDSYILREALAVPSVGLLLQYRKRYGTISIKIPGNIQKKYDMVIPIESENKITAFDDWIKDIVGSYTGNRNLWFLSSINLTGLRILISKNKYDRFYNSQPQYVTNALNIDFSNNDYVVLSTTGLSNGDTSSIQEIANEFQKNKIKVDSFIEFYTGTKLNAREPDKIAKIWMETIGSPTVPFDKAKRDEIADSLGDDFKRHLDQWRVL